MQRVKFAKLFYKTLSSPNNWTALEPTYDNTRGQETVDDIVFDGGIEICQHGDRDSDECAIMWKLRLEPTQYDSVHVDEY